MTSCVEGPTQEEAHGSFYQGKSIRTFAKTHTRIPNGIIVRGTFFSSFFLHSTHTQSRPVVKEEYIFIHVRLGRVTSYVYTLRQPRPVYHLPTATPKPYVTRSQYARMYTYSVYCICCVYNTRAHNKINVTPVGSNAQP